jgi:UDP-glucose 4-epimerase
LRYLLTGGAGFIGSHLADALVAQGADVTVLDDLSTGSRANVEHLLDRGAVRLVEGTVLDRPLVDELVEGCDTCVHLASAVGVQLVVANPLDSLETNIQGTYEVVQAAARHDRRLLYASTSEVYGKQASESLGEEHDRVLGSPFKSRWNYAIAKSYGEALISGHNRSGGLRGTVVRLFNTVGPRQTGRYGMVVPRLVRQALDGEPLTVYGDGSQTRCFGHVLDVVRALLLVLENEGTIGHAFNVGNTQEITIIELAERILARTGSGSTVRFVPYDEAYGDGFEELGRRRPDTTALRDLTGWAPRRTVDDAIDDVIAFQRGGSWTVAPDAGEDDVVLAAG